MAYQEIIDNINNRIETIISERLPNTYQHITIEPDDYTPSVGDTVTITITATDQGENPIEGLTIPLKINETSIPSLVTDSNGEVEYQYTCDLAGVIRLAVNSYTTFLKVEGYNHYDGTYYDLYYNDHTCYMEFNQAFTTTFTANTTWTDFSSSVDVPSGLRPAQHKFTIVGNNGLQIVILNNGRIQWTNRSSSNISSPTIRFNVSWRKQ